MDLEVGHLDLFLRLLEYLVGIYIHGMQRPYGQVNHHHIEQKGQVVPALGLKVVAEAHKKGTGGCKQERKHNHHHGHEAAWLCWRTY